MKVSQLINYPLRVLGLKLVRLSRLKKLQEYRNAEINDIEKDKQFIALYEQVKDYTMVGIERCYALYKAVQFVTDNDIKGDFAECGVWRGGSCMMIAFLLMKAGISDRKIWLYDTFSGMTEPGEKDGDEERIKWKEQKISAAENGWCLAGIEEVKVNMARTKYPVENINYIKGRVEDTIPASLPAAIALLRLDTDWYESTKHELFHLYPLLQKKGILIIDDYGKWQGSRDAANEYFASCEPVFFNRIDNAGILIIK